LLIFYTGVPNTVFSVFLFAIGVAGLIGNVIVLMLLLATKEFKKTNTNWLVIFMYW